MNESTYASQVGARMRVVRGALGLSLRDAGTHFHGRKGGKYGVGIGAWERGDRDLRAEDLAAYARFLGVPVRLLLPPADDQPDELGPVVAAMAAGRALRDLSQLEAS